MFDTCKRTLKLLTLSVVALGSLVPLALACAFHGYTPRPTIVDVLYESEQVVLARVDPVNPNRFRPIEALAGTVDLVELPDKTDAAVRAKLRAAPQASVLFARDGAYGPWVNHGMIDPAYRAVLDTALAKQNQWQGNNSKARAQFFADQLANPSDAIRRLALLELDRVDYATLRAIRIEGLAPQVAALNNGDPALRPIRLLLAGLSGDKRLSPILSEELHKTALRSRRHLGAYSTALIELDGPDAVTLLAERYLSDEALSIDTQELIIEAMAIQGLYGSRPVKRALKRDLSAMLDSRPKLAGAVARQFSRHGNWTMAKAVAKAKAAHPPKTAKDRVAIAKYIAYAG